MAARGKSAEAPQTSLPAGLSLLVMRGVLLWLVVPAAYLTWLPISIWPRRRGVNLGQFLGWVDLNLVACLQRTVLRPLFRAPIDWVPVRLMPGVTHRVDLSRDLA